MALVPGVAAEPIQYTRFATNFGVIRLHDTAVTLAIIQSPNHTPTCTLRALPCHAMPCIESTYPCSPECVTLD